MGPFERRRFVAALGASVLASPSICQAQTAAKVPRIGVLSLSKATQAKGSQRGVDQSLERAGYKVGTSIFVEWRFAEGEWKRLYPLTEELVRLKSDVLLAFASDTVDVVARQAPKTIPIVFFAYGGDPIANGHITSFARPGGNVTGTTWFPWLEHVAKQCEVLRQALPSATRIAALNSPGAPPIQYQRLKESFGFEIENFVVRTRDELPATLMQIAASKPDALLVGGRDVIRAHTDDIVAFARQEKLVTIGNSSELVWRGGLLYYGPNDARLLDRTIDLVKRILHGARPGDLPVEQPSEFVLLFNAKTARAIGYTLPPVLQLRVDRVIE